MTQRDGTRPIGDLIAALRDYAENNAEELCVEAADALAHLHRENTRLRIKVAMHDPGHRHDFSEGDVCDCGAVKSHHTGSIDPGGALAAFQSVQQGRVKR